MPARKYSLDSLTVAAAFATTMTEMIRNLGEEVTPGKRANLWSLVSHYKIDTSHFERSPHGTTNIVYRTDDLARAVANSQSIAGVMRLLGIKPAGGSHFWISKRIRDAGLDTSHFLGQAHFRGQPKQRRVASEVLVVRPSGSTRVKRELLKRAMTENGVPYECACCGLAPQWQGQTLTLAVDHINGDWLDNRLANLRFLCPNCHSQTSTWCRRKGS